MVPEGEHTSTNRSVNGPEQVSEQSLRSFRQLYEALGTFVPFVHVELEK
jgi:hypothetical protein